MPSKTQPSETLHFLYTCLQNSDYKTIDFSAVGAATRLNPPAARMRYTRLKRQIESGTLRGRPFQRPGKRKRDGCGGGRGGEGDDDDDDDEEGVEVVVGEGGERGKTGKNGSKTVSNESDSSPAHERSTTSSSSPAPPAKRPTKLQQRQLPSRGPAATPRPGYIPDPPPISADSPAHPADDEVPSSGSSESHGSS